MFIKFVAKVLLFCSVVAVAKAEITVEDSLGKHSLKAHPTRVAALNWDVAEQVLELGIKPIAMTDIGGYQEWVVQPAVPEGVVDIGTRTEPNLSLLAELKPDVILIASPQRDLMARLSAIAPVLFYQNYSAKHKNAEAVVENYQRIAQVLNRQEFAKQRLQDMQQELDELAQQLRVAYKEQVPEVAAIRFASTSSVYLYDDNSIPVHALNRLGIETAMPERGSQWGVAKKRITELAKVEQGMVLYFEPFAHQKQLDSSRLWQAMPFVKHSRVSSVPATWSYGGAMSILYNARALSQSLLELAPQ
ncbi:iron-siderophore ABC transporter substrate-binding protein [Agarivorans sp. Alg241-V36]|uniref:iron-siderophore ABC transporter substrate-binding protein n=1 Tax=Agarivorans sp. Alg241-V36 TaxID=2305992 RepID=UPI0013D57065|nr:iron-siderophore ABC transporter substrate-binding protein [Agarivorans sp. Alg241-V36]